MKRDRREAAMQGPRIHVLYTQALATLLQALCSAPNATVMLVFSSSSLQDDST
jgi:hypothetical protein